MYHNTILFLIVWICSVSALLEGTGELYLIDGSDVRHELAQLSIQRGDSGPEVRVHQIAQTEFDGDYKICGSLPEYQECFSYVTVEQPLSFEVELSVIDDRLERMSIQRVDSTNGITAVIRPVETGPSPQAVKLKKRTQTYDSKKKAERKGTGTAAFEEDVEDNKSFIQKNWKYIVIGLVLYALMTASQK